MVKIFLVTLITECCVYNLYNIKLSKCFFPQYCMWKIFVPMASVISCMARLCKVMFIILYLLNFVFWLCTCTYTCKTAKSVVTSNIVLSQLKPSILFIHRAVPKKKKETKPHIKETKTSTTYAEWVAIWLACPLSHGQFLLTSPFHQTRYAITASSGQKNCQSTTPWLFLDSATDSCNMDKQYWQ